MNERTGGGQDNTPSVDPMSVLALLLGGLVTWGGLGWLADWALGIRPVFMPIGLVFGAILAVYMIYLRYVRS